MIPYTVRQTFLVLVSVFYRFLRTFFGVIAYFINYYIYILNSIRILIITYTIKSGGQTKEEGKIC